MKKAVYAFGLFVLLSFSSVAEATLIDRGNGLIFDTVLNITWIQDANLCVTLNNCVNPLPGLLGRMTWFDANTWAANLVFQGFDDWRLPSMDVNGDGVVVQCQTNVDCPDNEYGHMYFQNLNGVAGEDKTGTQVGDGVVILANIQRARPGDIFPSFYWSGTEFAPNPVGAWSFSFFNGGQDVGSKNLSLFAWAVRPGDVLSVPAPGSAVLMGVGLFGLGLARRLGRR